MGDSVYEQVVAELEKEAMVRRAKALIVKNEDTLHEELIENVITWYGIGIALEVFFSLATGTTVSSVQQILAGPFALVGAVIGLAKGFAKGGKKFL